MITMAASPVLNCWTFFIMEMRTEVCSLLKFLSLQNSTRFVYNSRSTPCFGWGTETNNAWDKIL